MPIDWGLSHSLLITFTASQWDALLLKRCKYSTFQLFLLYVEAFSMFTAEKYVLSTNKNLLADTSGYIAAHICKTFPSPVPLSFFLSSLAFAFSNTNTHTQRGSKC